MLLIDQHWTGYQLLLLLRSCGRFSSYSYLYWLHKSPSLVNPHSQAFVLVDPVYVSLFYLACYSLRFRRWVCDDIFCFPLVLLNVIFFVSSSILQFSINCIVCWSWAPCVWDIVYKLRWPYYQIGAVHCSNYSSTVIHSRHGRSTHLRAIQTPCPVVQWSQNLPLQSLPTCATRLQYYSISHVLSRRSDYRSHTHDDNRLCAVCVCFSQRETFGRKTMLARAREFLCYCLHGR